VDTCPKNDVISFSRKRFWVLGLEGLGLDLGFELRLSSTFSVKLTFGQVY